MSSENQIAEGELPSDDTIDTDSTPAAETEVAADVAPAAPAVAKKVVKRKPVAKKVIDVTAATPASDTAEHDHHAFDEDDATDSVDSAPVVAAKKLETRVSVFRRVTKSFTTAVSPFLPPSRR